MQKQDSRYFKNNENHNSNVRYSQKNLTFERKPVSLLHYFEFLLLIST